MRSAFADARERGVPVLLSVGYSACHWCHVMAHESFEDDATAAYLNEHYVSIKVDREERPDVDAIYMQATTAMTGHGGWPMTVVLDHDGNPFFAGTYFPDRARGRDAGVPPGARGGQRRVDGSARTTYGGWRRTCASTCSDRWRRAPVSAPARRRRARRGGDAAGH